MTLREFADALAATEKPDPKRVVELTQLAIQLQASGVRLSLEELADRSSFAAWIAAAKWRPGREVELAADFAGDPKARERLFKEVATLIAEAAS